MGPCHRNPRPRKKISIMVLGAGVLRTHTSSLLLAVAQLRLVVVPDVVSGAMRPTTESLARWLHRHLEGTILLPARLVEVAVFESPDLGARYPA